jgi:hypothetical protein
MKHYDRHVPPTESTDQTEAPRPLLHDEIAAAARELWLQQGCPENCDEPIWLEAERRLLATREGASGKPPAVGSVR